MTINYQETLNIAQFLVQKKIEPKNIAEKYKHIKKLSIFIYIIDTPIDDKCSFCESLKNSFDYAYIRKLHELLCMPKDIVEVNIIRCDWNGLFIDTNGYKLKDGSVYYYPHALTKETENYLESYGDHIEYYPALKIELETITTSKAKTPNGDGKIIWRIQALGKMVDGFGTFKYGKITFKKKMKFTKVNLLEPLMNFLSSIDPNDLNFDIHKKFSQYLGQYERIASHEDLL